MNDLLPIESAPKDGTIIWGTHDRGGDLIPLRKMYWGVGKPHTVEGDYGQPMAGYVVNGGRPWWLNAGGQKLAPTPSHWRPVEDIKGALNGTS